MNVSKMYNFDKITRLITYSVNLAGEYMDLVLALSLEWNDTRLMWNENDFGDLPVKAIQVATEDIWTPNIDLANRIHNYSPNTERYLKAIVSNSGRLLIFCGYF